jgi:hypothetical protein
MDLADLQGEPAYGSSAAHNCGMAQFKRAGLDLHFQSAIASCQVKGLLPRLPARKDADRDWLVGCMLAGSADGGNVDAVASCFLV